MIAARPFSHRCNWAHHEKHAHRSAWPCSLDCDEVLPTVDQLQVHLQTSHHQGFKPFQLQQALTAIHWEDTASVESLLCPLRNKKSPNFEERTRHVGHHLEELAWSALPRALFRDGVFTNIIDVL